ncbi:MAG: hypothetical protein V4558_07725 [Gemmatimonadota bacterium]
MSLEIFTGASVPALLLQAREALGPDAQVLQVRSRNGAFELIASSAALATLAQPDFADFGRTLAAELTPAPRKAVAVRPPESPRPGRVIAVVGPTGAGKTTTIAKLATNPLAFGGRKVGLLGLDTFRVGAVEQLSTYAELASLPIEVVYAEGELQRALSRLADCEVVLVDTPGRGPRQLDDTALVGRWVSALAPNEVHLALPAGHMPAMTRRVMDGFRSYHVTHLLATKLDECPEDARLFDIAVADGRPMRWFTDGQHVPQDLRDAADRIAGARERRDHHRSAA